MEKTRPVLSISMLVSNNRRDTIEKCMESLVPLMKVVPSELIIVDTGCTDGSVDVARTYADKVVQFTWCKDFSAARNTGLRECTGEWFLYLDDDEWFDDVSELIAFFQGKEKDKCDTLWYIQRNYDSFEGTGYTDTYVGRCVKMTPETKFYGKIHEWLEPLPKVIKKVNTFVHHYGYVFKCEEDRLKHLERNLVLEEAAVKENPDDIRMCCQLVQEYWVARRYDDALALCESTLDRKVEVTTGSFTQYLYLTVPRIHMGAEKYEAALEAFQKLEEGYTLLRQTKMGLYYERAQTYGYLKREEESVKEYLRYLEEFYSFPKVGDPVEHPVMDFARYQSELFRNRAVEYAVTNMICGEVYSYGEAVFDFIDWKKTAKQKDMLAALVRCYLETGNRALLEKHFPVVLQEKELEQAVYAAVQSAYDTYPEKRELLLKDLESLRLQSGNFPFFHLLYTERKGITTEQDINDYYEKSDRKYDAEVVALFFTGKELFPLVLAHTSMEQYAEAMLPLVTGKGREELESLWKQLPALTGCYAEEKQSFLLYATMVIAEKRLATRIDGANEDEMTEMPLHPQAGVRDFLQDYIDAAKRYAEAMYRPELLDVTGCAALPANLRFVYTMEAAMWLEHDFAKWGEELKKAAREYPALLPVVKALLSEKKKKSEEKKSAQQELLELAEQLKAVVRTNLAQGKTEEAVAILSELAQLLPEDEEVKELLAFQA